MNVNAVFSGYSVNNIDQAKDFYTKILGLDLIDESMGLRLRLPYGAQVFIYEKPDHQPASFTILNFVVADIDTFVDILREQGVTFERYDSMPGDQDEKGIMRSPDVEKYGPTIAWFKDPAGNILSVIQDDIPADK